MNNEQLYLERLFPLEGSNAPVQFSPIQADALIEGALDGWQAPQPQTLAGRWRRALLLAAATFAVASAAAGLFYFNYSDRRSAAPAVPQKSKDQVLSVITPAVPVLPGKGEPAAEREAPRATVPAGVFRGRSEIRPRASKPAEDLLLIANQQRAQGEWRTAEQTYQRVSVAYPNSPSAYVASIASASIRLEHLGDPTGALTSYQHAIALNPDGALDIEARIGVARCYRRLANRDREIAALKSLLHKYSSGPIVQRAQERLEQISGQ
jgi:tetratricopeptide (TPR) repeat protein